MSAAHSPDEQLTEPTQCLYWTRPDLISEEARTEFDMLKVFTDEESPLGNVYRHVSRCKECGQLYFIEVFYKNRKTYMTYIPVDTVEVAATVSRHDVYGLMSVVPRLQRDYVGSNVSARWVTSGPPPGGDNLPVHS